MNQAFPQSTQSISFYFFVHKGDFCDRGIWGTLKAPPEGLTRSSRPRLVDLPWSRALSPPVSASRAPGLRASGTGGFGLRHPVSKAQTPTLRSAATRGLCSHPPPLGGVLSSAAAARGDTRPPTVFPDVPLSPDYPGVGPPTTAGITGDPSVRTGRQRVGSPSRSNALGVATRPFGVRSR